MQSRFLLFLFAAAVVISAGCGGKETANPNGNRAPNVPGSPVPANNATDVSPSIQLTWQCGDPDGDPLEYGVYFGSTQQPPLVIEHTEQTSYQPTGLQPNSSYYWMITARDTAGSETDSPVWHFTTSQSQAGFQLLGHYNAANATAIYVEDNYAYLLSSTTMMILNVDNPASPVYAGAYSGTSGPKAVYVANNRAYILGDRSVDVVSVSNPASPSRLAVQGTTNNTFDYLVYSDAYAAVISVSCSDSLRNYYFDQTHFQTDLYSANYYWAACPMWNMAQAATCRCANTLPINGQDFVTFTGDIQGRLSIPGARGNDLAVSGNYAYAALGEYGLEIINITDQQQPEFAGAYVAEDNMMGVFCNGNVAFLACSSAGVVALDVSNPANPTLIDSYQTEGDAKQVFYLNNRVYVAASSAGLYILEFSF